LVNHYRASVSQMSTDMFRNHNPIISSFMTYHRVCNKSNTMGATCGAGTPDPSGAFELAPGFYLGCCCL